MHLQREQLVALLQREMRENSGWERIHAADALLDHNVTEHVVASFQDYAATVDAPFRVGAWRVMARVSNAEERERSVQRLRSVMLDARASDRLAAAESLAKLGVSVPSDALAIETWVAQADDATAAFPLWVLVLSTSGSERSQWEARLAKLLESTNAIARLRAGFALGRITGIAPDSLARLSRCAACEPADSPARTYLLSAALLQHTDDASLARRIKDDLVQSLRHGSPAEKFEAAVTIGKCGTVADAAALQVLLHSPEPDARIGAASGLLYLMR